MEEVYEKINFHGEGNAIGLIDFSTENDELILDASMQQTQPSENWKEFSDFDLMGSTSIDAGKEADIIGSNNPVEFFSDPIKSPEPERAMRKGKCNLRKSLAWDSAFFTNAGVLDPEELSSIIGGAEKNEKHMLPQIVEDVSESNDSFSTLESDNLTLENLEVGFFEDIRASIQKSNVATDMLSIKAAPKKVDPAISNKASRSKAVAEKPNTIPKALPKQNILPRVAMKAMKHEPQDIKSAAKIGVSTTTTTTKASRIIGSGNHISTAIGKRASISAAATQGIKVENGASISIKRAELSKLPAKSSSISTSIKKNELLSRLSSDSSKSLPPVHATISPVKAAARRKLGNGIIKSTSDSTRKSTTRTAPTAKDRAAIGNSNLSSTCLVSSKNTSSISPSSERSSASSTSASEESYRSSGYNNLPLDLDQNSDQRFEEHDNGGRAKDFSSLTSTLSHPVASMKPSGLRKPSPSIGFFNGMKAVRTPKGSLQHGGVPLPSAKAGGPAVSCRSQEFGVKPNPKKHHSTPIPEMTIQCSDEVARDAEIIQCDQKENGVSEKVVVEIESKVGGGGGGGGWEDAASVFSVESLNDSRDPLADIKVVCSGKSQENFDELSTLTY